MDLVWLLCIFVLFFGELSLGQSKPDVDAVNVGAIFTFSTINGKVAQIAMKAAENDVNADPTFLGGRRLSISMHDSNFSGFLGIIGGIHSPRSSYFQNCFHRYNLFPVNINQMVI